MSDSDSDVPKAAQPGEVIDISGDGKLTKKIITPGRGHRHPQSGAEVTVHYVGTLHDNGEKFDSSRDRSDKFKFRIGQGQVIRGWDEGVATMLKGEKALLTCSSEYGYGDSGSPPKIPGGATLDFEVELFEWSQWDDVSQGVFSSSVEKGEGWVSPGFDSEVEAEWKAFLTSSDADPEPEGEPLDSQSRKFFIGDGSVPAGLEEGIEKMKKGERSFLKVAPQKAYGSGSEDPKVPADSWILFDVSLKSFEKAKDPWVVKGGDKIVEAEKKKAEGTECYKAGQTARAQKKYEMAAKFAASEEGMEEEAAKELTKLRHTIKMNIAACGIRQKDWGEVKKQCDEVLGEDGKNGKALLRRGRSSMETDDWEGAQRDFESAKENGGAEAEEATKEIARLAKVKQAHHKKEKALFSKLFAA